MNNQTIGDIYANNDKIRENTKQLVASLSDEQKTTLPDGEKWTIAEIVEHIAIVQDGMTKISAETFDAGASRRKIFHGRRGAVVGKFRAKAAEAATLKFEAPDRVRPTGNQSTEESLQKLEAARAEFEKLRPLFESVECSDFKFPHPFMGDLTAHEWLALDRRSRSQTSAADQSEIRQRVKFSI